MTKKDYVLIAEVLGKVIKEQNVSVEIETALDNEFCKRLQEDNPNFQADKFSQYTERCTRLNDDLHFMYKGRLVARSK